MAIQASHHARRKLDLLIVIKPSSDYGCIGKAVLIDGFMACIWPLNQRGARYDPSYVDVILDGQNCVLVASNNHDGIGDILQAVIHLQHVTIIVLAIGRQQSG